MFYPKATGSRLSVVKKGACAQPLCIRVIRATEPPGLRYPDRIMIENKRGPFVHKREPFVHCRIKTTHYTSPVRFCCPIGFLLKRKIFQSIAMIANIIPRQYLCFTSTTGGFDLLAQNSSSPPRLRRRPARMRTFRGLLTIERRATE